MTLDPYQKKLEDFISVVPIVNSPTMINKVKGIEYYGAVESGSPSMPRTIALDDYKKQVEEAKKAKKITNNATFTTLTGITHEGLLTNWAVGGLLTSCNGFVGKAGAAMGAKGFGGFNVEKMLQGINKGHCWLTPAPDRFPRYGDIFETRSHTPGKDYLNIHVGVSLEVDGTKWHTIEGGQGGPRSGVDRVFRCVRTYNTEHLLGWVDMKSFVANTPPLPDWLIGAWLIYGEDKKYVYNINRISEVTEHVFMGLGVKATSATVLDSGRLTLGTGDNAEIRWNGNGGVEKLTYDRMNSFPGLIERCTGVASDGTAFTGVRL